MTDRIKHKITKISDEICETCSQFWEGECRAFNLAHSEEEQRKRLSTTPKCKQHHVFVAPSDKSQEQEK